MREVDRSNLCRSLSSCDLQQRICVQQFVSVMVSTSNIALVLALHAHSHVRFFFKMLECTSKYSSYLKIKEKKSSDNLLE